MITGKKTVAALVLCYVLLLPFTLQKPALNLKDPRLAGAHAVSGKEAKIESGTLPGDVAVKVTTRSDSDGFDRLFEFTLAQDLSGSNGEVRGHLRRALGLLDSYKEVFGPSELSQSYGRRYLNDLLSDRLDFASGDAVCVTDGKGRFVKWAAIEGATDPCRVFFSFAAKPGDAGKIVYQIHFVSI